MNQLKTHGSNPTHPRLIRLQRRYRDIAVSLDRRPGSAMPMAATYVPCSDYGIAFDSPVAPVGSVMLCIYGQEPDPVSYAAGKSMYYRGLRARYQRATGRVDWELDGGFKYRISVVDFATSSDEKLMQSPKYLDILIGLYEAAQRTSERPQGKGEQLTMPQTLLGFRRTEAVLLERLSSIATAWVRGYADQQGVSNEQAWRALYAETRLPNDIDLTGLRLVDARLCMDDQIGPDILPQIVTVFHDMRPLLGRRFTNPTRKLPGMQFSNPAARIIDEINARRGQACDPGQWTQAEANNALAMMGVRLGPRHVFFDQFALSEALVAPDKPVCVQAPDPGRILCEFGAEAVAQGLRCITLPETADGCSDQDLIDAFIRPYDPLVASRIATRQVW